MPVLMFNQNGTVTSVPTIAAAIGLATKSKMWMVVTSDQVIGANLALPAGSLMSITNGAKITVNSGVIFDLSAGQFVYPQYECFTLLGTGSVTIPAFGSLKQDFNGKIITAATRFVGPLTGNVTGNADTATQSIYARLQTNTLGSIMSTRYINDVKAVFGVINPDGTILSGSGFTVSVPTSGEYDITYQETFSLNAPITIVKAINSQNGWEAHATASGGLNFVKIRTYYNAGGGAALLQAQCQFAILAMGA